MKVWWVLAVVASIIRLAPNAAAFVRPAFVSPKVACQASKLQPVEPDQEGVPLVFLDPHGDSFIECFAESVADLDGRKYTIGVPCDYAVAICYESDNEFVRLEVDDPLMDDIFPVAESIVFDEFGEELVLQRTSQTLTLVGELEEDDDDDDLEDGELGDGEEEVEVLLTFEHRGKEYNLVRLLDPVLLVAREGDDDDRKVLLSAEESSKIMPVLEDLFLEFHAQQDDILP